MAKLRVVQANETGEKTNGVPHQSLDGISKAKKFGLLFTLLDDWVGPASLAKDDATREGYKEKTKQELVDELTSNASAAGMEMRKKENAENTIRLSAVAVIAGAAGITAIAIAGVIPVVPFVACGIGAAGGSWMFVKGVAKRAKAVKFLDELLKKSEPAAYAMLKLKGINNPNFDLKFVHPDGKPAIEIKDWDITDGGRETRAHFRVRSDGEIIYYGASG